MKLSFLGKTYDVPLTIVQGQETYEMLTYMGKQCPRKDYTASTRTEESMTLPEIGRPYIR